MRKKGKTRAAKKADVDRETVVCELSKNRRVSVRRWRGMVMVDIREFYFKGSKTLPGKKGISLTMDQWNVMQEYIDDINEAVAEYA